MAQPRLFIQLPDSVIAQGLNRMPVIKCYRCVKSADSQNWVEQLASNEFAAAVIEATDFCERDYLKFLDAKLASRTEFIFLSKGTPNPWLDKAIAEGAGFHYRYPFNFDHIEATLDDLYRQHKRVRGGGQQALTSELEQFGLLVGSSPGMHELFRTIRKVACTDAHVFVVGESGVGKELVANTIHLAGKERSQPFVALNCGALSPELVESELFGHVKGAFTGAQRSHRGVFEQAEGGTLFLDEITEMPLEHQVKLLRVLESGEYRPVGGDKTRRAGVRVIAATNRDPEEAIANHLFREDLYFRLAQFPIQVPPLRTRGDDVTGLARHFLAYRNAHEASNKSISDETLELLRTHSWPGNVRELKHAIERAYILADKVILPRHVKLGVHHVESSHNAIDVRPGMALSEVEKVMIENTLAEHEGNKTVAAEQLGISVKTLYNKLGKYQRSL